MIRKFNELKYYVTIIIYVTILAFIFAEIAGSEATLIVSCTLISSPGYYILNQDILNSEESICINISSSDVVFDGAGYNITGKNNGGTFGVYVHNPDFSINNVTVKNLIVTDWERGIFFDYAQNGSIINNTVNSNSYGIKIISGSNNFLLNNSVNYNWDGIHLEYTSGNNLTNNTAGTNSGYGIHLINSIGSTLKNNTMLNNQHNFDLDGYEDQHYNNSIDTSNTVDGKPVFYLMNALDTVYGSPTNAGTFYCIFCSNVTVQDLEFINNQYGVFFLKSSNSTIKNVNSSFNDYGIILKDSNNNSLENNTVGSNYMGMVLYYSSGTILKDNIIKDNTYNFDVDGWDDTHFDNNIDTSNTVNGKPIYYIHNGKDTFYDSSTNAGIFYCISCDNVTIKDLELKNNIKGITFWKTSNSTIENINANSNSYGIYLKQSSHNILSNNTATLNYYNWGIFFEESNNNRLINNDVSSNKQGFYFGSSANNTLSGNKALNNDQWDFYTSYDSLNNTINDLNISNTISFTGKDIALKASSSPANDPSPYRNISKFIKLENTSSDSWIFMNVSYDQNETLSINESSLRLWRYNGSWSIVNGINDVNTDENYVFANITEFSIFAPMGEVKPNSVHNINNGINYSAIQEAINDASSGDEIHVDSGTYYENVFVDRQLILRGFDIGGGMPVVDANGVGNPITLTADGVFLDGFNAHNSSSNNGIEVVSSNNIIFNNNVSNNYYGIHLASGGNTLTNNTVIRSTSGGIFLSSSPDNKLINNTVFSNGYGIYTFNSSNNTIIENRVFFNSNDGITLDNSANNTVLNNNVSSNANIGIYLYFSGENDLTNNILISNSYGINIDHSDNNGFTGNTAVSNTNGGIYIASSSNAAVINNTYNNNCWGIYIGFSNNNTITGNAAILNSNTGITFDNSTNNIITDNNASSNGGNGIYIYLAGGNTLSNNKLISNSYGINLDQSNNNAFTGNTAISNTYGGIRLSSSHNNSIIDNIENKNGWGIYLGASGNNTIIRNEAILNNVTGISLDNSSDNTITDNNASSNKQGFFFGYSVNNTLSGNKALSNDQWDFYSSSESINNTIDYLNIGHTISFTGKDIALKASSSPANDPSPYQNISKYIQIENTSLDSWIFMNLSYDQNETMSINESSLRLWRYNGSWSKVSGINDVNTDENYVFANITDFSIFAPMGEIADFAGSKDTLIFSCTLISSPGSYILNKNILNSNDSTCININSSDVILDGAGYAITGINNGGTSGVYVRNPDFSINNVTVKNLIVTHWENGIFYDYAENGSIINNTVNYNREGIYLEQASGNNLTNNNASSNEQGFYFGSSVNNTLSGNKALNNDQWDFYTYSDSSNNTISDLNIGNTISFIGKDIALKASSSPANDPSPYQNISKFIKIENTSLDSWIFMNLSYDQNETLSINESSLRLWRYNGSWSKVSGINDVNIDMNYVFANITDFSIFAPMGEILPVPASDVSTVVINTTTIANETVSVNETMTKSVANISFEINATLSTNITITINTSTNASALNIFPATDEHGLTKNQEVLGKYVQINMTGMNMTYLNSINLTVYYNDSIEINKLDENTLKMYWFDPGNRTWMIIGPDGNPDYTYLDGPNVSLVELNVTGKYIKAVLNRLGYYTLAGEPRKETGGGSKGSDSDSRRSGGVISSEPSENIDEFEMDEKELDINKFVKYLFNKPELGIDEIEVFGEESIFAAIRVEKLNGTSNSVTYSPPGILFRNINIWMSPARISQAIISFKVENLWLGQNDLVSENIKLMRWAGTEWVELETETSKKKKDRIYTYFEANTSAFSHFAITGIKSVTTESEYTLQKIIQQHPIGKILFNVPNEMNVGETKMIEVRIAKNMKEDFLFNWNEVSGNNSKELKNVLAKYVGEDEIENATINKTEEIINITAGNKSYSIILNENKTQAVLEMDNAKQDFSVKEENGSINIYTESITFNLLGPGEPRIQTLRVNKSMKVKLVGNTFDIMPLSTEEQFIEEENYTSWYWDVTPRVSGNQSLKFTVSIGMGNNMKDIIFKTEYINVNVSIVNEVINFIKINWQWIVGFIMTSGIITWLVKKWRKSNSGGKKRKSTGMKRKIMDERV